MIFPDFSGKIGKFPEIFDIFPTFFRDFPGSRKNSGRFSTETPKRGQKPGKNGIKMVVFVKNWTLLIIFDRKWGVNSSKMTKNGQKWTVFDKIGKKSSKI